MSGMSGHTGSAGAAMSTPSHGGGKGTIVLQDSPQLTSKVHNFTPTYLSWCEVYAYTAMASD